MTHQAVRERWLPTRFEMTPKSVSVGWMDFGSAPISEPFFHQTLRRLRTQEPPAATRTTPLGELFEAAGALTPIKPSGIILHVSRCGSTHLANLLRAGRGVTVLCEARHFGSFFHPFALAKTPFPREGWEEARAALLNSMSTLYGHSPSGAPAQLVIKCNAINILHARMIRRVWPDLPAVILVRDPLEVMVSNFGIAAGWVRWKQRPFPARLMGMTPEQLAAMPLEEYCARMIGLFCRAAAGVTDDLYRVFDYSSLDLAQAYQIAAHFGIEMPSPDSEVIQRITATYAKDPEKKRRFEDDCERRLLPFLSRQLHHLSLLTRRHAFRDKAGSALSTSSCSSATPACRCLPCRRSLRLSTATAWVSISPIPARASRGAASSGGRPRRRRST